MNLPMDFFTIALLLLLTIILIQGLEFLKTRGKKLPPGPTRLPIIGNLHLIGDKPHKSLTRLAKTHGPIMCLRLGQIDTVVISSSAVAKEVLQKQDLAFSSRSIQDVVHAVDHYKYSMVYLPVGSTWRNMRKILNSNVFSGNSLDGSKEIRRRKVAELVESCRSQSRRGEAVDIGGAAFTTSLNLLSNTIFSRDLADPFSDSAKEFKELVRKITVLNGTPNFSDFFPVLARFDPQGIRRRMTVFATHLREIFRGMIDERLEKQKLNHVHEHEEAKKDAIDVLLAISQQNPQEIDRKHIEHLCLVRARKNNHILLILCPNYKICWDLICFSFYTKFWIWMIDELPKFYPFTINPLVKLINFKIELYIISNVFLITISIRLNYFSNTLKLFKIILKYFLNGGAAFTTSLNLLSNTIFSRDLADPFSDSAKEFKELVRKITVLNGTPNFSDFFPVLARFDPQGIRRRMTVFATHLREIFRGLYFCILLLKLVAEELVKSRTSVFFVSLFSKYISIKKKIDVIIERLKLVEDLFIAGTDTTSVTVEWAMAELLKNPDVMKKAKAELDDVIGKGKVIDESDLSHLPYLRSIVKETLRLHAPVPFLVPRRVGEDIEVCGYIVPKNSQVFVNAWAIARDPETWNDPLEFKPERFVDSEVNVKGRDFDLIPFGAGRRICPGLPLAMRVVPVMVGSLLNCFEWKVAGGMSAKELDMEEKFGITLQKAYPLHVVPIPV
uniref:Geraniol 10-hydroxylase n=1 Tax=Bacopa monnieri TaxID=263974 RepID=A0A8F2EG55_BACMN|nr:geraniol 10-hydroxylase [Bacopa monnieri]